MGWGQWEEGIIGTTIKDTWIKPRGRVEVGEGGGFNWGGDIGKDLNDSGHIDKTKGEGGEGEGRWVHLGWGRGMGRKGIQL